MSRRWSILTGIIAIALSGALFFACQKNNQWNARPDKNIPPQNESSAADKQKLPLSDPGFAILWFSDFNNNRVVGFDPAGKVVWAQNISASPLPSSSWYFIGGVERVTVAPNGNLIDSYGDAMMVQEIDRKTHNLVWQYGTAGVQTYRGGKLDEPHKAWKINDHELVINDSNDREVIVVDQRTNQIVWQYGQYHVLGNGPDELDGNTSVLPLKDGQEFLITETLANKVILIDRATKKILWQYTKPNAKWLENVTPDGDNFIVSDRLKGEVFEVDRAGKIVWDLDKLSDESHINYPTDTAMLGNGDILIDEAGAGRVVEAVPATGQVVRVYKVHGFASTIAIDQNNLDGTPRQIVTYPAGAPTPGSPQIVNVDDATAGMKSGGGGAGDREAWKGKVESVNASTGKAGQLAVSIKGGLYAVEVYNYSRVVNKSGAGLSLDVVQKGDDVEVTGTERGNNFIAASLVKDNSR
ncbi:MAG: PQQ-binding-like beta-propeller repeat protein [Candidatus Pacebacteria bacterium]|nr:PQQ-binding-like beta-propeller repeat protein [Candidatus Paceibacterota bacterium]MDR3583209.1 PQQ-binding-like beta-propeller repeat protein [Candidatus Paceibacterota bacterium]